MTTPTISVIVPAHDQERFIGRCLRSLLNQTRSTDNYEIIVVNDGSTDRTDYALELFRDEIKLLANPTNMGLPASLNRGIKAARGRFVVRVDADDYVHHEYLNVLAMHLELNGFMDAVACDYLLVDDSENTIRQIDCLAEPIGCGIMFRFDQLIDIGLYDESFLMREEEDLRKRFEERHAIHRVALPLYRYRRHEKNMTNDADGMAAYKTRLDDKHNGTSR